MADVIRFPSGEEIKEYLLRRGAKIIRLADVYDPADLDPFAHDQDTNQPNLPSDPDMGTTPGSGHSSTIENPLRR